MAESTLATTFTTLQNQIGDFFGFGSTSAAWSADSSKTAKVDRSTHGGYRRFLNHPIVERFPSHVWSFLRPFTEMVIWSDDAVTAGITVAGGAYSGGVTTLTGTGTTFYNSMIGRSIVITSVGTFTITSVASNTSMVVSGNASAASGSTFSIASGGRFQLPDDFGHLIGRMTYRPQAGYCSVGLIPEQRIREIRQTVSATGKPTQAAVRPKAHTPTGGQRWELYTDVDPDTDYTMGFRYGAIPDALSSTNLYPMGGALHGDTLLYACLSVADELYNQNQAGHRATFMAMLEASIRMDIASEPDLMGYNGDASALPREMHDFESDYSRFQYVTVNGIVP